MGERAFSAEAHGTKCITFAGSASKAKTNVVRSANDAGYKTTYADVTVRRAPDYDRLLVDAPRTVARAVCWVPSYLDAMLPEGGEG